MENIPKKPTQKDYSLSFKLQIVKELEQGSLTRFQAMEKYDIQADSTIRSWLKKYSNLDYEYYYTPSKMREKSPEQMIFELEQALLSSQKNNLH